MTDYKQLCAELLEAWDTAPTPSAFVDTNGYGTIQRIRAALAKSKSSEGVSDSNHPITPPPQIVQQIANGPGTWLEKISKAYCAGADQELEGCCKVIDAAAVIPLDSVEWLRAARRPKPPSIKQQALRILAENGKTLDGRIELEPEDIPIILSAIQSIPEE